MATTPGTSFDGLSLRGSLRPYQRLALDAFETDRAAGRRSTHLVAPPGSGKTVIGLEIVRRLDRPALVLAPTATISAQWADKLGLFTEQPAAFLAPEGALHVLTYQSICQTSDPGGALRAAAEQRLVQERAVAIGAAEADVQAEVAAFTGAARERFERDMTAEVARSKKAAVPRRAPRSRPARCSRPRRAPGSTSSSRPASARSSSTSATTSPRCGATSCARSSPSCPTCTSSASPRRRRAS